jgi:hypothetical protein
MKYIDSAAVIFSPEDSRRFRRYYNFRRKGEDIIRGGDTPGSSDTIPTLRRPTNSHWPFSAIALTTEPDVHTTNSTLRSQTCQTWVHFPSRLHILHRDLAEYRLGK